MKAGFWVVSTIIMAFLFSCTAGAQSAESASLEKQFYGMWRLVSWEKEYTDGSVRPDPRTNSYITYTDSGRMCWVATDPNRPKWTEKPTQQEKAEAFDGLGFYCAEVELNMEQGYVVHHLDLARSENAVGIKLKRWFTFDGKDRLLLRVEPSENQPPLVESRLVWERVK